MGTKYHQQVDVIDQWMASGTGLKFLRNPEDGKLIDPDSIEHVKCRLGEIEFEVKDRENNGKLVLDCLTCLHKTVMMSRSITKCGFCLADYNRKEFIAEWMDKFKELSLRKVYPAEISPKVCPNCHTANLVVTSNSSNYGPYGCFHWICLNCAKGWNESRIESCISCSKVDFPDNFKKERCDDCFDTWESELFADWGYYNS